MPKGGARPGAGRPKGSRNASTRYLKDVFKDAGMDPNQELMRMYDQADDETRLQLLRDFGRFLFHAVPTEQHIEMNTEIPKMSFEDLPDDPKVVAIGSVKDAQG